MIQYNMEDVLRLNGIEPSNVSRNGRYQCPFCPGKGKKIEKNLGINLDNEKFNCFSCGVHGRGATLFHAYLNNLSTKEAYADIMQSLGMKDNENVRKHIERPVPQQEMVVQSKMASSDALDETYRSLICELKLTDKHRKDLINRGFMDSEIDTLEYVTFPKKKENGITPEYFDIPKRLLSHSCTLSGIPGFYKTKNKGVWCMSSFADGIIVPYRNFYNQICGIQIRRDDESLYSENEEETKRKYVWFSSNGLKEGCKAEVSIHYACDFTWNAKECHFQPLLKNDSIILTEGGMKADLAHAISGIPLIAVPGVSCANEPLRKNLKLLKAIGLKTVLLGFDMDIIMNYHVMEALINIKKIIKEEGLEYRDLTWNNEALLTDGTHIRLDYNQHFVLTVDYLNDLMESERLIDVLEKIQKFNIKNLFYALPNSKAATEENKNKFLQLKAECKKFNIEATPILWRLALKGIDDYYAFKKRNINYK